MIGILEAGQAKFDMLFEAVGGTILGNWDGWFSEKVSLIICLKVSFCSK